MDSVCRLEGRLPSCDAPSCGWFKTLDLDFDVFSDTFRFLTGEPALKSLQCHINIRRWMKRIERTRVWEPLRGTS